MDNLLPNSISGKEHLSAFDKAWEDRLSGIDVSALIPNLIDTVPEEALPYLAKQFNVLGFKGWRYTTTPDEQRALLKKAVELHKYDGTAWSIKEALKLIGITPVQIVIGQYKLKYNGEQFYNGGFAYGDKNPFTFQVQVNSTDFNNITQQIATDMVALIMEHKAARDLLTGVNVNHDAVDSMKVSDGRLTVNVDNGTTITTSYL